MKLYHVTPNWNVQAIIEKGILPECSQGRRELVWLTDDSAMTWALVHTEHRHKCPLNRLMIIEVHVSDVLLKRTRWAGVFTTAHPVKSGRIITASKWVEDAGIDGDE